MNKHVDNTKALEEPLEQRRTKSIGRTNDSPTSSGQKASRRRLRKPKTSTGSETSESCDRRGESSSVRSRSPSVTEYPVDLDLLAAEKAQEKIEEDLLPVESNGSRLLFLAELKNHEVKLLKNSEQIEDHLETQNPRKLSKRQASRELDNFPLSDDEVCPEYRIPSLTSARRLSSAGDASRCDQTAADNEDAISFSPTGFLYRSLYQSLITLQVGYLFMARHQHLF